MLVKLQNLFSISEANRNFSNITKQVDEANDVIIIKNNKPSYVVIDIARYRKLLQHEQEVEADESRHRRNGIGFKDC